MVIRLKEIAEAAGVQTSTVSLVLRDHPKSHSFTPATRERILTLADHLGYYKNNRRGAKRCGNIAFLLAGNIQDGWTNHYFTSFLNGIEDACNEAGCNLIISRCRAEEFTARYFPSRNGERAIDGVIMIGYITRELIETLQNNHLPCLSIGDDLATDNFGIATYAVNAPNMYMQILRYLSSMNHTRITLLLEERERQHALAQELQRELERSELAEKISCSIQFNKAEYTDAENGQDFLWHLVDIIPERRQTAVICNDRIGINILAALPKYNLKCPDDLSLVVGCDSAVCSVTSQPLSAVSMEKQVIGYQAARTLLQAVEESKMLTAADSRKDFQTRLIIRDSVKSL